MIVGELARSLLGEATSLRRGSLPIGPIAQPGWLVAFHQASDQPDLESIRHCGHHRQGDVLDRWVSMSGVPADDPEDFGVQEQIER